MSKKKSALILEDTTLFKELLRNFLAKLEFDVHTENNGQSGLHAIKDKPQFDSDLEKAISYFDSDKSVEVAKEIGKFYHNKKNWEKAIRFYEIQLKKMPDDLETALLLFECYTEKGDFDVIEKKTEVFLQIYPTQPQFYYYSGLAFNQKGVFKKAKNIDSP